jgi:hypothetical protein
MRAAKNVTKRRLIKMEKFADEIQRRMDEDLLTIEGFKLTPKDFLKITYLASKIRIGYIDFDDAEREKALRVTTKDEIKSKKIQSITFSKHPIGVEVIRVEDFLGIKFSIDEPVSYLRNAELRFMSCVMRLYSDLTTLALDLKEIRDEEEKELKEKNNDHNKSL